MKQNQYRQNHAAALRKALEEEPLSSEDILTLLESSPGEETDLLFKTARQMRATYFGNQIFLYGFVYNSTICRNNCNFCYYRKDNPKPPRYSKSPWEILEISCKLAESGVHLIDLTMGESPLLDKNDYDYVQNLCKIVSDIKTHTGLPVMVSPGVMPDFALELLSNSGADFYACYQETHNRELFMRLRKGQSYSERLAVKQKAAGSNLLIEEGILCGVGETNDDIMNSFETINELGVDQTRVMGFVPQIGTPMEHHPTADIKKELIILAVMRLLFPDRLIPATLDVEGVKGLKPRLDAGANVVTSIVPAGNGLAGVAQNSLDIEDSRRTAAYVTKILPSCGNYEIATVHAFKSWIKQRKEKRLNLINSNHQKTAQSWQAAAV